MFIWEKLKVLPNAEYTIEVYKVLDSYTKISLDGPGFVDQRVWIECIL